MGGVAPVRANGALPVLDGSCIQIIGLGHVFHADRTVDRVQVGPGGSFNDVCGGSLAHNGFGLAEVHMHCYFSQSVLPFGSGVDAVALSACLCAW